MTNTMSEDRLRNVRAWAAARPDMSGSEVIVGAIDELLHLREVLTFPIITPEASSHALFIRVLSEHEKGQPVNGQDLINALMWRVKNQRREIARLQEKRAAVEPSEVPDCLRCGVAHYPPCPERPLGHTGGSDCPCSECVAWRTSKSNEQAAWACANSHVRNSDPNCRVCFPEKSGEQS